MCTDIFTPSKKIQDFGLVPLGLRFTHCPQMHLWMFCQLCCYSSSCRRLHLGYLNSNAADVPINSDQQPSSPVHVQRVFNPTTACTTPLLHALALLGGYREQRWALLGAPSHGSLWALSFLWGPLSFSLRSSSVLVEKHCSDPLPWEFNSPCHLKTSLCRKVLFAPFNLSCKLDISSI